MAINNVPSQHNETRSRFKTSDETIRALFYNIPIPTTVWQKIGQDFILVDYNDAVAEITGGKIDQFVGAKADGLFPDVPELNEELLQCFQQKTCLQRERSHRFVTSGVTKHFSAKYVFVPPDLVLIMSEDITARIGIEDKLKDSEKRYRELADLLPQTIFETDAAYNITYCNQAGFEYSGYTPNDLQKGLNLFDLIVPEEREKLIQNILQMMNGKNSGGNEYTALRKDGTTFPASAYTLPIIRNGKVIGLRGVVIDISKLKAAQQALVQVNAELENRVNERTAELSKANELLKAEIAERKHVEKFLKQSEEKYRAVLEQSIDLICIIDAETKKFVEINSAAQKMLGYSADELKNIQIIDIYAVGKNNVDREFALIEKGQHLTGERQFKKKNGALIDVDISANLIGKKLICGMARDITERKRAEAALQASERRYRSVVEDQTELICRHLPDGTISFVNEAYCRFLNKKREEIIGKIFQLLVSEQDQKVIMVQRSILTLKKPVISYEHQMFGHDGKIHWFHRTDRAIFDDHGMVQEYQSVAQDITVRKQAEAELEKYRIHLEDLIIARTQALRLSNQALLKELAERQRAESALQLSKQRFELLYEENPSMYFTINLRGKILSVNKFGAEQLGYSVEELLGKSVFTVIYKDDKKIVRQQLQNMSKDTKQIDRWEFRKICKDGRIMWVKESARLIRDDDGKSLILIVCEDITERIKAQRAQEKLTKELTEREHFATLGQFVASLTHEISNPLDIILTDLDALKDDYHHLPELVTYTEKIKEQVFRINRLARDILSYAKPQFLMLLPVDVNKIVMQTIELLRGYQGEGVTIATRLGPNLPLIPADAIGLEIVFKNIILNAIQSFQQKGTIIIITKLIKDDHLRITIKDNGAGIEKSRVKNIFNQFHTSKQDSGGTGLGLAISLEIVKKHHGTINVKSQLGSGTTFNIYFPVHSQA